MDNISIRGKDMLILAIQTHEQSNNLPITHQFYYSSMEISG